MDININSQKAKSTFSNTIYNGVYNSPVPMFFTSAVTFYSAFSQTLAPVMIQMVELNKTSQDNTSPKSSKVMKLKVTNSTIYNLIFATGNAASGAMFLDDDLYDATGLSFVTSSLYLLTNTAYLKRMFMYTRTFGLSLYALNLANALGYGYRFVTNDFKKLSS
ncbi:hypothetical protein QEN19_000707 [Hanseniaspora menglaensis]